MTETEQTEMEQTKSDAEHEASASVSDDASAPAPDGDGGGGGGGGGEFTEDAVRESLKAVIDPELGMNIVDLGLVYEVSVTEGDAYVQYTLTTMGCPIGPLIEAQMKEAASALPGFKSLTPEIVFRPAWTPEMMSEEAKAAMGVF